MIRGVVMENNERKIESCNGNIIHEDIVVRVKDQLPAEETLYDLAELFKVFGDTTRIKIICALFESEMCVCDLAILLNMTKSAISHQLSTLRENNLVKFRREGKMIFYSLSDYHVKEIFEKGMEHIKEK